jgi:TatD DNase family protein
MTTNNTKTTTSTTTTRKLSFVDIGANLLDECFTEGTYFGKKRHEPDWDEIMERAAKVGVTHLILTAGTLDDSRRALELVRLLRTKQEQGEEAASATSTDRMQFACTIGVHPTRCLQEFVGSSNDDDDADGSKTSKDDTAVLQELLELAVDGQSDHSVCAIGEIGLDYDRLEFCPKDIQQHYLLRQLETFDSNPSLHPLPLFLHNRNVGSDLLEILVKQQQQQNSRSRRSSKYTGVIHSFDDSLELALRFIDLGFYIGLNGCSLKTEKNLKVVQELPLNRILLETDCPYCEIKPTHAGFRYIHTKFDKKPDKKFECGLMVKGRNEPCQIIQVAEVIASVKNCTVQHVADVCYQNSLTLYGWAAASSSSSVVDENA